MKRLFAVFLILCMSMAAIACGTTNNPTTQVPNAEQEEQPEVNTAIETTLGAGEWYVGDDIPAGRYVVSSNKRAFIVIYNEDEDFSDYYATIDPEDEEEIKSFTYELKDGQKIEISHSDDVLFTPKE